jgi:hypothetical protein
MPLTCQRRSLISVGQLEIELRDASDTTFSDFAYGIKAHGWLVLELEMEGKRNITAVLEDRDIDEFSGLLNTISTELRVFLFDHTTEQHRRCEK